MQSAIAEYNSEVLDSFYDDAMKNPSFKGIQGLINEQRERAKYGNEVAAKFILSLKDESTLNKLLDESFELGVKSPLYEHLRPRVEEQLEKAKSGNGAAIKFILYLTDERVQSQYLDMLFRREMGREPIYEVLRPRIEEELELAKSGVEFSARFIVSLRNEIPMIYKDIFYREGARNTDAVDNFYGYLSERVRATDSDMFNVFSPVRRDLKHFENIGTCLECIAKGATQRDGGVKAQGLIESFRTRPGEVREECVEFINDFKQELWGGHLPEDVYRTPNFVEAARTWALLLRRVSRGIKTKDPLEGRPEISRQVKQDDIV